MTKKITIKRYFIRLRLYLFGKPDSKNSFIYYRINTIPQFSKPDKYEVEKVKNFHTQTYFGRFERVVKTMASDDLKTIKNWIKWDKNKPSIKTEKIN
jgi:hypothetical protein